MSFILYFIIHLLFWLVQRMLCTVFSPKHSDFDFEVVVIIRTIMADHRNFFWCVSQITNTMRSSLIFPCGRVFVFCISFLVSLPEVTFPFPLSWLFLLHALLDLCKTSSPSLHLWRNHVCFCCYQINSVWIMNNHTVYVCLFLNVKDFVGSFSHTCIFSSKDSVSAKVTNGIFIDFYDSE